MKPFINRHARRWIPAMALLLAVMPLASACSTGDKASNEKRTLRIGVPYGSKDQESYFRQQYTDMFEVDHPNIEIEIVNAVDYSDMQFMTQEEQMSNRQDPEKNMRKLMEGDNPVDVIMTDLGTLSHFTADNLLKPLDPLIKSDKFDTTDILPSALDSIRNSGNGQLYALSPTFYSSVLFYNKKIFSQAGVNPPTDGMTWDQVFALARSVTKGTGKNAVYGLSMNNYSSGLDFNNVQYTYGSALQLKMFDDKAEHMTVNTPAWKKLWEEPLKMYKDHVMPHPEDYQQDNSTTMRYNQYSGRPFFQNNVAMVLGDYYLINDLATYNKYVDKLKGKEKVDWDVVTVPVHPGTEETSGSMGLSDLSAINAKGHNQEDAWAFIQYLNGEDLAKLKSRSSWQISVRKKFAKPKEGMSYHMEAFTNAKPAKVDMSDTLQQLYQERPNLNFIGEIGNYYFQQVVTDKLKVDAALEAFEKEGNELLQKIKKNPSGDMNKELEKYRGGMNQGGMMYGG